MEGLIFVTVKRKVHPCRLMSIQTCKTQEKTSIVTHMQMGNLERMYLNEGV